MGKDVRQTGWDIFKGKDCSDISEFSINVGFVAESCVCEKCYWLKWLVCSTVVTVCLCAPSQRHKCIVQAHTDTHTHTQVRHGVGINVAGQLNWALVVSVGDPAVRQPEALDHTGLSGKFPEDLYGAGI